MTLQNSSLELVDSLKVLQESTAFLLVLITETRPYEHALAHRLEDSTSDVLGRLDAALIAAVALQQVAGQFDLGEAFRVLVTCHTECNLANEKLYNELKLYDLLQDLF